MHSLHYHEPLHIVEDVGMGFSIFLDPLSCVSKDNLAVMNQGLMKQYEVEMKKKNGAGPLSQEGF